MNMDSECTFKHVYTCTPRGRLRSRHGNVVKAPHCWGVCTYIPYLLQASCCIHSIGRNSSFKSVRCPLSILFALEKVNSIRNHNNFYPSMRNQIESFGKFLSQLFSFSRRSTLVLYRTASLSLNPKGQPETACRR